MKPEHFKYVKYIISGGSSTVVSIASLYLLTEFLHIYYVISAAASFLISFAISFVLQKFWTFQNTQRAGTHRQLALYLVAALGNLVLSTSLIYAFVQFLHVWYMLAALISAALIAVESFFLYRHWIFIERKEEPMPYIPH